MGAGMYVYIWESASGVTDNYHDGGGLLIVAPTLEDARARWDGNPEAVSELPSHILSTGFDGPLTIVFPDVGCC